MTINGIELRHVQVGHSLRIPTGVRQSRWTLLPGDSEKDPRIMTFLASSNTKEVTDLFVILMDNFLGKSIPLVFKDTAYLGYVSSGWAVIESHLKKPLKIIDTTTDPPTIILTVPKPLFDISFEFFGFEQLPEVVEPEPFQRFD